MLIITVEPSQWQEQVLEMQFIMEEDRINNRVGVWSFTWNIKLCKQRIHINYFILKIKLCKLSWIAPFNSEDIPMARLQEGESGQQLLSAHSQPFVPPFAPRSEECLESGNYSLRRPQKLIIPQIFIEHRWLLYTGSCEIKSVRRVFAIFATNASFSRVIANL